MHDVWKKSTATNVEVVELIQDRCGVDPILPGVGAARRAIYKLTLAIVCDWISQDEVVFMELCIN